MMKTTPIRLIALFAGACLWAGVARADLDQIKQAAEAGDAKSQLELGILFQYGFNYKDNEIPALTWYMLSANQGNARAASLRDTLRAKMSESDVHEAEDQVAKYKPKGQMPAPAPMAEPAPAPAPEPPPAVEPTPAPPPEASAPAEPAPMPEVSAPPPAVEPVPAPAEPAAPPAEPSQLPTFPTK